MKNTKILLVEDEFPVALDIKLRLQKLGYEITDICDNYTDTIESITENSPDIIIMDINISGDKNGIQTAEAIYQKNKTPIIFLTANGDERTFKEALETNPFGFLLKPFKIQELSYAIQIAVQKQQEQNAAINTPIKQKQTNTLFIKDRSKLVRVSIHEILWIEAMDNYTRIVTQDKKVMVNMFLKEFYEKIPKDKFLRIHRSYIIALSKIDAIENRFVIIGNEQIPFSKAYRKELFNALDIL
ncbi:LytR/AlgR family response regulator transcription factor [Aquimarina hainanensis]|uniref:LytR/AlgR family response regulator transcription factor n=1 Tax=Aquimarina hainanensis TaxID=1578017 RepID=A0ABW5N1N9_9FLAO|nr:response regulator [Aquimarina sp. TRL1]QKX04358.1 response regulator [Aquimarina sp. TRL1]